MRTQMTTPFWCSGIGACLNDAACDLFSRVKDQQLGRQGSMKPDGGVSRTRWGRLLAAAGVYLDYTKNRITDQTLSLLLELALSPG
jgi:hypothetical protein